VIAILGCKRVFAMQGKPMNWLRLLMILTYFAGALAMAEEPIAVPANGSVPTPAMERTLLSLQGVAEPLAGALTDLGRLRAELQQAATEEARRGIQMRIDSENERIRQLRGNFRDILGGAEAAEYEGAAVATDLDLKEQISQLIQPIVGELREASARPRELDALRKSLANWTERQRKADVIAGRITTLIPATREQALIAELESARRLWDARQAEAASQISVIRDQIEARENLQKPFWDTLSGVLGRFFRSRGLNLLLAISAGVAAYILVGQGYAWARRYSPVHRSGKGNLSSRVSDIIAVALASVAAVFAVMLVFYARGDWLLLTLFAILLFGIVWAGKTSLPPYLEQIRLILNLGAVREDERILLHGLPWRVVSIGFFTTLTNPSLQGGTLRIPIRDIMDKTSRQADPKEPWFPTHEGDWVILADETYGKIITQTPEQVVLLRLGGSLKTYPTDDFLELAPESLSRGFRVACTFGIDYRHQADAASNIPEILQIAISSALIAECGHDPVRRVKVEFDDAAASSLNFRILADFDGSMGSRYQNLRRLILRICLETCNAQGWVIPFTQITVHQAEDG
jgi:hypothetical protein